MPVRLEGSGCISVIREQGIAAITLSSLEILSFISTDDIVFLGRMLKGVELDVAVRELILKEKLHKSHNLN